MTEKEIDQIIDKLDLKEPTNWDAKKKYFSMYLPEETVKVLEELKDSEKILEKVLRRFIKNKFAWADSEIGFMEETTIKYQAHVIKIKDQLGEISDSYDETLGELSSKLETRGLELQEKIFDPFKNHVKAMEDNLKRLDKMADELNEKLSKTVSKFANLPNTYTITEVVRIATEWDRLSAESKALLAPMFAGKTGEESTD